MQRQVWIGWIACTMAIAACSAPPSSQPPDDPDPVAASPDYQPGAVSLDPTIQAARPKVTTTTLAGTGAAGGEDGAGPHATFEAPEGVATTPDGSVYVAEALAYRIRRIDASGNVSTLAGGSHDPGRDDGTGGQARFMGPKDCALGPDGALYVVDFDAVRKVTLSGTVTTVALHTADGGDYRPIELFGIACGRDGSLFLSSMSGIERVSPQGVVTRYAGTDVRGFADGPAARAYFNLPRKLALDPNGALYVADFGNLRVRRIKDGAVQTVAGNGILGYTDGEAARSRLNFPMGLAVDAAGNVLVADSYNHAVRQISPDGMVTTLAGNNVPGFLDGAGTAEFQLPTDVAVRPDGAVVVSDQENTRIRVIR